MITNKNINDYLHFGYIPEFGKTEKITQIFNKVNYDSLLNGLDERALIDKGINVLNNVFDDLIEGNLNKKHLIPLSGGLDSRIIFAALLDRISPEKINTITFGTPGSFDYDIPKKVVKNTNVNFERINCTRLDYSLDNLVSAALKGGHWTSTPDIYINQLSLKLDENYCRWSGFLGGEIAGEYSSLGSEIKDNNVIFANYQKRSKSITLTDQGYSPYSSLVKIGEIPYNLTAFELLFYYNRSAAGAIPIMYPDNIKINSPFMHPDWVDFIIKVPKKYRKGSYLFKQILLKMYPEIMNLPCKNNAGLGLGNTNSTSNFLNLTKLKIRHEMTNVLQSIYYPPVGTNYVDYKNAIKKLPSFKNSISEACKNLENRKIVPWISPNNILKDHLAGRANHTQALLILLGMEVNLRADELTTRKD